MNTQKLLMNPISNRILLFISKQKEATTLEVVNAIKDVSRATLYRYMKEMVEKNILEIVREEKVKGQIQKVYKVKTKIISDNENPNYYMEQVLTFLLHIYEQYAQYFSNLENKAEGLFMVSPSLMLDEAEYSEFCNEINKVLEKYSGKPYNKKRKVRNMYFLSAPDESWEEK